jgi:hypothetical protein
MGSELRENHRTTQKSQFSTLTVGVTGSIPVAPTIPRFKFNSQNAHDRALDWGEDLASIPPDSRPNDA